MYTSCTEFVVFMNWTGKSMNNLLSYYGLVDARISASDKDLPVQINPKIIDKPTDKWTLQLFSQRG